MAWIIHGACVAMMAIPRASSAMTVSSGPEIGASAWPMLRNALPICRSAPLSSGAVREA